MNLPELQVFLAVASERSFSKAAHTLHRTQSAVSQSIRRLEDELGERLIDRSTKEGRLTDAGRVLKEYAERLMRLADEAETAVRDLRDLRRGRVLIGANEAAVHGLLPLVAKFRNGHPGIHVDVRRVPARNIGIEVVQGGLDLGLLTFQPTEPGLASIIIDEDDLVLLVPPRHPLARRRTVHLSEVGQQPVVAHNDPSPARERILRIYEQKHETIDIVVSLPSLEAIKRAVEMGLGVAILPQRLAAAEVARGELVAIRVPELTMRRQLRLVHRRTGPHSHATSAFIAVAQELRA